ncbi:variant erythrocyte surface antigen-1 family protein [Babesia divergens]|uniref:Variant erythrocyte surface antigen-1 family protein n=1 Tax=Babesia divergens TaxID=32595 RepID=A0AAD9GBK2_BABDI|nr:variant erythrocyte surface antigen-1 family protein [Babesia divergens]
MCIGGEALPSSLSVLRTLRSVLIGSLEPLGRITLMVCYMYYTDVFVGTDNINKLKKAFKAVVPSFDDNSNDLDQLVHGLCLFMGYPSCLCKPKKSVKESLKKISKELLKELKNYKCLSSKPLNLNCLSCNSDVVCKCCVLDCINEVQTSCGCVKGNNNDCKCSTGEPKRCCKDLLEKLKASLSLLNLKTDMAEICKCTDENCCVDGVCTQGDSKGCSVCDKLKTSKDYTITGLGLLRPSPKRLAERLNEFFGDSGRKGSCGCKCGSGESCCCLACVKDQCAQACSCKGSPGCSCDKALKASQCPRKKFCEAIQNVKVLVGSSEMRCCESGKKCHCSLAGSGSNCQSGCCVVSASGSNKYHSLKCLLRRVVKFFKDLSLDSPDKCSKLCCELLCVLKICEFLKTLFNASKSWAGKECSKCKGGGTGKNQCNNSKAPSGSCCGGNPSQCVSSSNSDPTCCQGCPECNAIKLGKALQELQYSGPCGQDLWRTLDSFLYYCFNVFMGHKDFIHSTVLKAVNSCSDCKKSGPNSKNWQACECSSSSSGSCKGCQDLLKDSKLMSVLLSQYSSSYDSKASLTSSNSGDDDQRKAAKIFLGMLPCLYYGLKIVFDRCKYNSGFAGWHDISVSNDIPKNALAKFFFAWGFQTIESSGSSTIHMNPLLQAMVLPVLLENLFTPESKGILKNLYEKSKIYFTSFSSRSISNSDSPSNPPTTVREILLWLYGLRFHKHFSDLVLYCSSLCLPFGNSFHPDAVCYYIHVSCFLLPVSVISVIQCPGASKSFLPFTSDWESFCYPDDLSSLFEKLCEYVRKVFVALHFLRFQCGRPGDQGGWQNCWYGQKCSVEPLSSPSVSTSPSCSSCKYSGAYLCTGQPYGTDAHNHCKDGQTCLGFGSGSTCKDDKHNVPPKGSGKGKACSQKCPHPLQRFLVDGSSDSKSKSQDSKSLFGLSGIVPMGFSKENLSSTARDGWSLYHVLKVFCEDGFYPLTRLVQFVLCVSRYPPETLGEFFAFFKKFVSSSVFKKDFADYASKEPGFYPGQKLKNALGNLYGSHSGSHPSDLKSLYDCSSTKGSSGTPPTCGKYLHALTEYAYNNKDFIDKFVDTYLSYVCHYAPTFKEKLKEFQGEFSSSSCCSSGSCKQIVKCPCILPKFYKYGFTFNSPGDLACENGDGGSRHPKDHSDGQEGKCTKKSCSDFITQLEKVANGDPFKNLLEEIERFIWSIRKPFFFFILAFWAFVISYFLYVQLYKLDLLHLKSHAHFSRSFKILPSTLFSDASSRLKDLSYFTL